MKKILFSLCIISALLGLVGCETPLTYAPTTDDPLITLTPDTLNLLIGQTDTLVVTITPADTEVTVAIWESNNTKVAKVDTNGVVTARAAGEAIITLTTNIGSAQCVVTVVEGQLIISSEALECNVFETYQLTITTPEHKANAKVTWKSSNSAVASVDTKGNVTALSAGNAVISASVSGCSKAQCTVSVKEVPLTLPRKFLIEHFTGDGCGYCPYGMYCIVEHIETATTPYIWVSHHYGFNQDEYTIDGSSKIGSMLGVSGAPSMALNRTKQEPGLAFHPGYLPEITINDDTKTAMSVAVQHTYNASTRQLDITVSGKSSFKTNAKYLLTVLVKENRLVGQQADYYYAYGESYYWEEYMHARVARGFLTLPLGDTIVLENQVYSQTYSYKVSEKWVPENCCIVAYVTPLSNQPIINAEQVVLVEGTTGGEEYNPYGITESTGPKKTITFNEVQTTKYDEDDLLKVVLISNTKVSTAYGSAQPIGAVYIHTDADKLTAGTYPIKSDNSKGSIQAGYRIDEETSFGGSLLMYALSEYLNNGQLAPAHIWRMNEGEMVVDEAGNITLNFTTYNGTEVTSSYQSSTASVIAKKHVKSNILQFPNKFLNTTKNICK